MSDKSAEHSESERAASQVAKDEHEGDNDEGNTNLKQDVDSLPIMRICSEHECTEAHGEASDTGNRVGKLNRRAVHVPAIPSARIPSLHVRKNPLELSCSITLEPIQIHASTSVGNVYEKDAILQHFRSFSSDPNTNQQVMTKALLLVTAADLVYLDEKTIRMLVQKFWVRFQHAKNRITHPVYRDLMDSECDISMSPVKSAFFSDRVFATVENVVFEGCLFSNCVLVDVKDVVFRNCRFEGMKTKIHNMRSTVFECSCFGSITDPFLLHACFSGQSQMDATVSFISMDYCYMHTHSKLSGSEDAILSKQREFYREKLLYAVNRGRQTDTSLRFVVRESDTIGEIMAMCRKIRQLPDSYLRQLLLEMPSADLAPLLDLRSGVSIAEEVLYLTLKRYKGRTRYNMTKFAVKLLDMGFLDPLTLLMVGVEADDSSTIEEVMKEPRRSSIGESGIEMALRYIRIANKSRLVSDLILKHST